MRGEIPYKVAKRKINGAQGFAFSTDPDAKRQFQTLRRMYEPYLQALSDHLLMPLPPWLPDERKRDDWESEPSAIAEALPWA